MLILYSYNQLSDKLFRFLNRHFSISDIKLKRSPQIFFWPQESLHYSTLHYEVVASFCSDSREKICSFAHRYPKWASSH